MIWSCRCLALISVVLVAGACNRAEANKPALPSPSSSALSPPPVPSAAAGDGAAGNGEGANFQGFRGTGTIHAREKAELGPKTTGAITTITVDEGDRVKKGQLLFRVDAQQASLAVAQANAALESAKVAFASAELDFQRTKELFDRGSVAPATFDQAKARYDGAKTSVRQTEVAVSQAKRAAGDTAVYAPFSGIVTARLKSVGETATLTPPTVVLVLQDVDVVELRARMPERALRELHPGDSVAVAFPALDERRTVPITRINPTIDQRTRTVEIVAEISNSDLRLKPGMLAEVTFGPEAKSAGDAGVKPPPTGAQRPQSPKQAKSP